MKTLKKTGLKFTHNRQKPFFSQSSPAHSPQPKIDFSYYEYVPRHICLLICVILPFIPNTKAIGSIQQTVLSLWSSFEETSLKGGLREL